MVDPAPAASAPSWSLRVSEPMPAPDVFRVRDEDEPWVNLTVKSCARLEGNLHRCAWHAVHSGRHERG